jgi:hypothetical protein
MSLPPNTYTAGLGDLRASGPFRFHPDSNLGDITLTFAPGAGGAPDPSGDLEITFPQGASADDTVVSLDGGTTWTSFGVVSGGSVSDRPFNNNFFKDFDEFSREDPPRYLVLEIEGQEYIFFPDFRETTGRLSGNIMLDEAEIDVVVCFVSGTMIQTDAGERTVEKIAAGDRVLTRDRGFQPVRWAGRVMVTPGPATWPVRITAGALGEGLPARDLRVSPQHRVLVSEPRLRLTLSLPEALVPARHLVNGRTILREQGGLPVAYHHLLFDRHEVIYSEGVPTESFHPGRWGLGALAEEARAEVLALFPELARDPMAFGPSARPALRRHEALALQEP